MRGASSTEYYVTAHALTHSFVGEAFTVDLPNGDEFCSRLDGIRWAAEGKIRIFFPVPINVGEHRYFDLDRDAVLMFTRFADNADS